MKTDDLAALAVVFVPLSLISIGGGASIVAGAQHELVAVRNLVSASDFVQLFAIARASPGPGTMLATLLGWKVAGWAGAIIATIAIFLPSSLLCYGIVAWSRQHSQKRWYQAVRGGLAPIGIGLTIAGIISIFRVAGGGMVAAAITGVAALALIIFPRLPVLALLALGACAGFLLPG